MSSVPRGLLLVDSASTVTPTGHTNRSTVDSLVNGRSGVVISGRNLSASPIWRSHFCSSSVVVDLWLCPMAVLIGSYSVLLRTLLVGETEDPQR